MKNNKGFTLIELMFAISILGICLMCATALAVSGARNNRNANITTDINYTLKEFMEEMRGTRILPDEGTFSIIRNNREITYTLIRTGTRSMSLEASTSFRGRTVSAATTINNWGHTGIGHMIVVPNN